MVDGCVVDAIGEFSAEVSRERGEGGGRVDADGADGDATATRIWAILSDFARSCASR